MLERSSTQVGHVKGGCCEFICHFPALWVKDGDCHQIKLPKTTHQQRQLSPLKMAILHHEHSTESSCTSYLQETLLRGWSQEWTALESSAPATDQCAQQNPQESVLEASTPIYLPSNPRSHRWPFCGAQGFTFSCPWAFARSVFSLECSSHGWFIHFILVSAQMSPLQKAPL